MCAARNLPVTDWDLLLPEAVLAVNGSVNKSLKKSPFMCTFGGEARLPIDNIINIPRLFDEELDQDTVQQNARLNRQEARSNYKAAYDKKTCMQKFVAGQRVLVKRTHGKYPKISVSWVDGPFKIVKKIGPVNWVVSDDKGKSKVLHHNLIKDAGIRLESTNHPHYGQETAATTLDQNQMSLVPHGTRQVPTDIDNTPEVSVNSSSQNVLDRNNVVNYELDEPVSHETLAMDPVYTCSGRLSKPVIGTRLGE